MKKLITIASCFLFFSYYAFGQKEVLDSLNKEFESKPSIALTLAPEYFSMPSIAVDSKAFFMNSWHFIGNFFFLRKVSFSTGINALFLEREERYNIIQENSYNGQVNLYHKLTILSIPLGLNYYIIMPNSKSNFYLKTRFNNSFKFKNTTKSPGINGDFGSLKEAGYSNSIDFGLGSDYKIFDSVSIVFEVSKSFFISGFLPQYSLLEFDFGIKYKICKK